MRLRRLHFGGFPSALLAVFVCACGPLKPATTDAGSSKVDVTAPWLEVPMAVNDAKGQVLRLRSSSNELYAFVEYQWVQRTVGPTFAMIYSFDTPDLLHFEFSATGHLAAATGTELLSCASGCQSAQHEAYGAPEDLIAVCSGDDELALISQKGDGGTRVFAELGASWDAIGSSPTSRVTGCARSANGGVLLSHRGLISLVQRDGGVKLETPDTSALSLASSEVLWGSPFTAGGRFAVGSEHGTVAIRSTSGAWSTAAVTPASITALTMSGDEVWVVDSNLDLFRHSHDTWSAVGRGPELRSIQSIAIMGSDVYVGGTDTSGRAKVFRRAR